MENEFPKPLLPKRENACDEWGTREFLAMLGHDLRASAANVQGFLDLLADTRLDGEQRDYLETAKGSADELQAILEGILECLRFGEGRLILQEVPVDLRKLLQAVVRGFRLQSKVAGVGLRLETDEQMAAWWRFDAVKLRQILNNLLGNALKFSHSGEVVLQVAKREEGGVFLMVRDSGPGMPDNVRQGLFEAFRQDDGEKAYLSARGYGLGLAIVKKLVATMGGGMEIRSRRGLGTTVLVEFPSWQAEAEI